MAALPETAPSPEPLRRSFVWRRLEERGARFAALHGGAVAVDYGDPAAEAEWARRMGLADLSPLPRIGFKGAGAVEWLQFHGLELGPDSDRGYGQGGGEMALRLSPNEVLLVDSLAGTGSLVHRLAGAWRWTGDKPRKPIGYPLPRADSHCWFAVCGAHGPEMLAKLSAVDLRLGRFREGMIAQVPVAEVDGILLRRDLGGLPGFYLLADSAAAEHLWLSLQDAMAEFDGGAVGLHALRALG